MFSYVLALLINSSVVTVMLPNMSRLSTILKSEFGRTLEFLLLLEREIKWIAILNNQSPDFDDFFILVCNNNDLMVSLIESLLINRDHPPLNN